MPAATTEFRIVVIDSEAFSITAPDGDAADVVQDEGRWFLSWDGDRTELPFTRPGFDFEDALTAAFAELGHDLAELPPIVCYGTPKHAEFDTRGMAPWDKITRATRRVGVCRFCTSTVRSLDFDGDDYPAHDFITGEVVA